MVDLVALAWGIPIGSVFGGPSWVEQDRFDVIAKAPLAATDADLQAMLKALLADRFKLTTHDDKRPLEVFTLTVAKRNANLKEVESKGAPGICRPPDAKEGPQAYTVMNCQNLTMAQFALYFRQYAGSFVPHRIVDLTGLTGTYTFTLKWSPFGQLNGKAADDPNAYISFFEAVDQQLGLKLTPEKRPLPVLTIDSVNRTPTPNAPDVLSKLPPPPTEFEVAEVRPAKPDAQPYGGFRPGGRVDIQGVPLKTLIQLAWDLDFFNANAVVGAPKWVETDKWDIVAKSAEGTTQPPIDALRTMLRALLIERFKMKVHNEEQPMPVWALTVSKKGLKLTEADPTGHSVCRSAPGTTGSGSAAMPASVYLCTNTTMAQLAEALHRIAGAYVDHPAIDMTGLKGSYDFELKWTPKAGVIPGAGAGGAAASDPTGGITFFEALEKLGLHLEGGHKHPMPMLVVDTVEKVTGTDQ